MALAESPARPYAHVTMDTPRTAGSETRKRLAFAAFTALVFCVEWAVHRAPPFQRGSAVPLAILFDLVLVLPLVFAVTVLRPAKRPPLDAAPVLALGVLVAGALLASRPEVRTPLRAAGAVSELMVLALLVRRVRGAVGQLNEAPSDDLLLRIGALTDPVLRVLGAELVVLYYAFAGPFVRRPLRDGELTYAEKSGVGGLLIALGLVTAIEGLGAHLLLHAWSPRVAWVYTAFNVYALLWLAAIFNAARLRPVVLSDDRLLVRTSLLWTAEVPRATIASVAAIDDIARDRRVLRAALGTAPVLLLTLTAPVIARGPMGIRRSVRLIALYVDEPAKLRAALDLGQPREREN